jgi:NDP-sugar pyrophosphorylase family protein
LRGTAGALVPLATFLGDATFVILFGDNVSACDLTRFLTEHRRGGAIATVALYFRSDPGSSGVADLGADGRIARFIEKPGERATEGRWVNAGIVAVEPAVLAYVPRNRPSDLGRDVLPRLIEAGENVRGYRMTERLWWIDTPEDYERTNAAVSNFG